MFESVFEELDGAYAENTLIAYRRDIARFETWMVSNGKDPLEANHLTLIQYLEEGCCELTSASMQRQVAAIGSMYHFAELENFTKHPKVKLTLRKLNRKKGNIQGQAKPLRRDLMNELLKQCDPTTMKGLRNIVLLNLGYETMRRRSELVQFKFEDLRISASGEHGILLRYSKTDQLGNGRVIPISVHLSELLAKWRGFCNCGYILRSVNKAGKLGDKLGPEAINKILKKLELASGSEEAGLSGHSFRVGRTVDLVESGKPISQIALVGGWASESVTMRYSMAWSPFI